METNKIIFDQIKYAGFWRRFAALFIDGIIIWAYLFLLSFISKAATGQELVGNHNIAIILPFGICSTLVMVTFYAHLTSSSWQATIGKRAMGVYVVKKTANGFEKPDFLLCFKRYFSYPLLKYILLALYLNFYLADYLAMLNHVTYDIKAHINGLIAFEAYALIPALIWYLPAAFTAEKTALHDLLFNTRVLQGKK